MTCEDGKNIILSMKNADKNFVDGKAFEGSVEDVEKNEGGASVEADEGQIHDALKEALDVAQSVGDRRRNKSDFAGFGLSNFDDSVSLYEYIDEAEKKSKTLFDSPSFGAQRPVEDLDGLNIAAEFGRPDEGSDDADDDFSDISLIPPPPSEDTKDLKLNSRSPGPVRMESWETPPPSEVAVESESIDSPVPPFDGLVIRGKRIREGKLENERLWEVLLAAYDAKFRGVCILDADGETRSFLIGDGDVLESATTKPQSDLLSLLVREKYLTEENMKVVRREMASAEGLKFRDVLLKRGMLRLPEVNRLERYHHEALLVQAIGWSHGTWRIEPISTIREMPDAPIETPLPAMILRGLMDSPETTIAHRGFARDAVPVPVSVADAPFPLSDMALDAMQLELMRAWDGTGSMQECCEMISGPEERKYRFAAAMQLLGFLTVQKVKHETVKAPVGTNYTPSPSHSLAEALARKLEKVENGTYFDILEIAPDAGDAEIAAAWQRLIEWLDIRRFWDAGISDVAAEVALVRKIVDEAYEVLKEPARRGRYRKAALDWRDKT